MHSDFVLFKDARLKSKLDVEWRFWALAQKFARHSEKLIETNIPSEDNL